MKNILVLNPPSETAKNIIRDLIYGCWCKGKRIGGTTSPPLNMLYIATALKQEGHNVRFLDAVAEGMAIEDVKKLVKGIDAVIISTSSMSFMEDALVLKQLKQANPDLKTMIFGAHPTFMP
ncbi:MAG: cobalamin B12-binding domain-containing protein [Candidatus Aenigmarchaeota archaeon]|nr:cobalamin B12-binding domain-containing protein [Candidatus Aenigmarchaeota archaeon]